MDSVSIDDKFQKVINDSIESSMKSFSSSSVNIFNVCKNTKDIKKFLHSLVSSILVDLGTRKDFILSLVQTISIVDTLSIKLMELEKRVKELEERSV